ncbi:peptidase M23 [Mycobacterium sp. 852013-51886_SCH5428379]|nr:peptidase M23 [Mycobacterium sp. 852013-51886_SCH5428379]
MFTPLLAEVLSEPVAVPGTDGRDHLAYELRLTNVLAQDVTITSLEVLAAERVLLTLTGDQIGYWTRVIGTPVPTTRIGPGQTALTWLDVAIDRPAEGGPAAPPRDLVHRIGISVAAPSPPLVPATMTETVAPVTVQTREPAVIAPPLRGGGWLDGNSCCDMTAHRMAANPLDGKLWAAERFAIDYVQLGPDGRLFAGDRAKTESYPYFGADIYAVADGPVVAVVDNLPEQVPGRSPTGLPVDQYGGNHIVQDIGDGNFAFYGHLKTGSITVRPGDRLSTGQVIGALGNSGNTDAPHLHFHVMSTPDPLKSDGLPFVIDSFSLDNRLASNDALDPLLAGEPAAMQPDFAPRAETDVSPLVLDVMTYAAP